MFFFLYCVFTVYNIFDTAIYFILFLTKYIFIYCVVLKTQFKRFFFFLEH